MASGHLNEIVHAFAPYKSVVKELEMVDCCVSTDTLCFVIQNIRCLEAFTFYYKWLDGNGGGNSNMIEERVNATLDEYHKETLKTRDMYIYDVWYNDGFW